MKEKVRRVPEDGDGQNMKAACCLRFTRVFRRSEFVPPRGLLVVSVVYGVRSAKVFAGGKFNTKFVVCVIETFGPNEHV